MSTPSGSTTPPSSGSEDTPDLKTIKQMKDTLTPAKKKTQGDRDGRRELSEDSDEAVGARTMRRASKATTVGGVAASPVIVKIMELLRYLRWLKKFLLMLQQIAYAVKYAAAAMLSAVLNFLGSIVGWVVGAAKGIASVAIGLGQAAISAMGSVAAAATAGAVLVGGVLAGAAGLWDQVTGGNDTALKDGQLVDCTSDVSSAAQGFNDTMNTVAPDAQQLANAQRVYSILAGMGMSDENIAGILGNWSVESQVDPTAVETIYDEKYVLGPRKLEAQEAGFDIAKMDADYAARFPAINIAGVGLGQWTNERNTMLMQHSQTVGAPWETIDTQLGFMFSHDDPARVSYMNTFAKTPAGDVRAATEDFLRKWEGGNPDLAAVHFDLRQQAAANWMSQVGAWEADEDLANSILDQVGTTMPEAESGLVAARWAQCRGANLPQGDNSTIAAAAVSFAWPNVDMSRDNNGTALFQFLHDAILPGDTRYMSCDRTVATAVRWAGADDEYPQGAVINQLNYLQVENAKPDGQWKEVVIPGAEQMSLDEFRSNLMPGDVLIRNRTGKSGGGTPDEPSHTLLYVSAEQIAAQMAGQMDKLESGAEIVHGSYERRSPAADNFYDNKYSSNNTGHQTYRVFRNMKPEASSKYSGLVIPENLQPEGYTPGQGGVTDPTVEPPA